MSPIPIQDVRREIELKRPEVAGTVQAGEKIIGDCRFSDTEPARETLNQLTNAWEDLLEIASEM